MSRKKRFKHAAKKEAKLEKLALAGLATVTVGMVGTSLVHADDAVPAPSAELVDGPKAGAAELPAENPASPVSADSETPASEPADAAASTTPSSETNQPVEPVSEPSQPAVPEKSKQTASGETSGNSPKKDLVVETEEDIPSIKDITVDNQDLKLNENVTVKVSFNEFVQPFILKSIFTNVETGDKKVSTQVVERQAIYDYSNVKYIDENGKQVPNRYPNGIGGGKGAAGGYAIDPSTPPVIKGYTYEASIHNYFNEVGKYKLELEVLNLENKSMLLDEDSRKKISKLPEFKVSEGQFVEGNIVEVKVNKTTVDQDEKFTYTIYFDNTVNVSYNVQLNLKTQINGNEYTTSAYLQNEIREEKEGGWNEILTGRSYVRFNLESSEKGKASFSLEQESGYYREDYENNAWVVKKIQDISQANLDKLAHLSPTVAISDKRYTPAELVGVTIVSKDGKKKILDQAGFYDDLVSDESGKYVFITYVPLVKVNVGDKIIYTYKIKEDFIGGFLSQNLIRRGSGKDLQTVIRNGVEKVKDYTVNDHSNLSRSKEVNQTTETIEYEVTANMSGLYQLNNYPWPHINKNGKDYSILANYAHIFQVINPNYVEPRLVISKQPTIVYQGQSKFISASLENVPVEQVETFQLTYQNDKNEKQDVSFSPSKKYVYDEITKKVEEYYEGGYNSNTIVYYGEDEKYLGTYRLVKVQVSYKDGTSLSLDELPESVITFSNAKKSLNNVLLSGDDVARVSGISRDGVYSSLGRLPKELLNRNLNIEKIIPIDKSGNIVNVVNAEVRIDNSSFVSNNEGVEYFYYLPLTGTLTKLSPVKVEDEFIVTGVSDFSGVFVKAYPIKSTDKGSANYKVVTNEDTTIQVALINADVQTITAIKTAIVTDNETLAKLPATHQPANVDLYDIKTVDKNGQFKQISGEATVTLPVDPSRKVTKIFYFLPETGAVEELPFEWNQQFNQVTFKVTHFSQYGIQYEKDDVRSSKSYDSNTKHEELQKAWDGLKDVLTKANQLDTKKYTAESYDKVYETELASGGKRKGNLSSYLKDYGSLLANQSTTVDTNLASDKLVETILIYRADTQNLNKALVGLIKSQEKPTTPVSPTNPEQPITPKQKVYITYKDKTTGKEIIPVETYINGEAPTVPKVIGGYVYVNSLKGKISVDKGASGDVIITHYYTLITPPKPTDSTQPTKPSDKPVTTIDNKPTAKPVQTVEHKAVTQPVANSVRAHRIAPVGQAKSLPETGEKNVAVLTLAGVAAAISGFVGLLKKRKN
ncbi:LPXTG cell wall anchor domain-containing protein [Streptococcus sp. DD04]|uniref:LPXTG cell wall anchor domain-containing protein n=1 Tax=Streptococcus sp. DD04 TaxID=1776578 RepID=UPI00078385A6|nr:LPXTG cell wall anchor domain-containing protein [Streptococcus sp. DD04]KXT64930.1 hypothetical protein STRDD04_01084 [Streptococcus sp. DD04]